jgi:hypothetical protein
MRLHVGERLEGAGPANQPGGYVVTGVVRETPWYGLYTGKKVLYNFDFTAKRLRETDEVEWLDIFLRTVRYPVLDNAIYVQQRRALARAEVRLTLGNRRSNLWPEPIDLLELENTRDPFGCTGPEQDTEPIAVLARPHGRFTEDWQRRILPVSAILAVLAELLEFVRQAHEDGLLLQGLGPAAILIDDSDRAHYLGSDMVLELDSPLLREPATAEWGRLFPPERFPPGYVAPECVQGGQRPDARSDLYAWGALVCALVSGSHLTELAHDQGRAWLPLQDEHFAQVGEVLSELSAGSVRAWAEQLGIPGDALVHGWPGNLLGVLRLLLSPEPTRRPRSVAELRAWLIELPPPTVARLVALHVDAGAARLLLDCSGLDPELQLRIQRGTGAAPAGLTDGVTAYEGPLRPVLVDAHLPMTGEPIFYTAFTRRSSGEGQLSSAGVSTTLWQPSPANVRRWAEQQAAQAGEQLAPPSRIGMVLSALDPADMADALLVSTRARVRGWVLWRLEQGLNAGLRPSLAEPFLWRLARDPSAALRPAAALCLWQHAETKNDELLLRLLEALESTPVDAPVSLGDFLEQLRLPDQRIAELLRELEALRPTQCPLCQMPITLGERSSHLRAVHGYLELDGDVLPAETALTRLWERTLYDQDRLAHDQLLELYLFGLPAAGGADRYVADLERQLQGPSRASQLASATVPIALPFDAYATLVRFLRHSPHFSVLAPLLLRSPRPRLRELGREALVPLLADRLRGIDTGADVSRELEAFCPGLDLVGEKLLLCDRLSMAGVEQVALRDCAARLREDRLLRCPECSAEVRQRDLEIHLRRTHDIYEFRGVRGSYAETRAAILRSVCSAPPDAAAWRSLQALVEDRHRGEIDRYTVAWLYQYLKAIGSEERGKAVGALAETVVATASASRLLPLLLGPAKNATWELLGKRLAVEIAARLEPAAALELRERIQPLLAEKALSRRCRENATMALLRATGKAGPTAIAVLRTYVSGSGKLRALQKLQQLEQRFGQAPAIEELTRDLDGLIRMTCPRCPTQLRKKDMVQHLWERHRLVLDGQCVREPWRVLEDWAVDYALEKDAALLERCRELAVRAEPEGGLLRLYRLMFRHGVRDRDFLTLLQAEARRHQASLCPYCFEHVPAVPAGEPAPLTCAKNRLEGHGYRVEVSERGLLPELRCESPAEILYQGREPGRGLTRLGGLVLLVAPLVVLVYVILDRLSGGTVPAAVLGAGVFGLGLFLTGIVYMSWPNPPPVRERLLRAAWNVLVPELFEEKLGRPEWAFLRALAEISEDQRRAGRSPEVLATCCEEVAKAARSEPLASVCLAALCRLLAADRRRAGLDAVGFLVEQGAECFRGKYTLTFLVALLEGLRRPHSAVWSLGGQARVQVLLARQAFLNEVALDDWFALGHAYPELGSALALTNRWQWLQRYAVWIEHNRRPWAEVAPAVTVYDLAERGDQEELLDTYPDLLLYAPRSDVIVGSKGVWYQGICVGAYGPGMDVYVRRTEGDHPWEVVAGNQVIPCRRNPREAVDELQRWLAYYFQEFLPRLPAAAAPVQESDHNLWQAGKVACPSCGRALVPCLGDVGIGVR